MMQGRESKAANDLFYVCSLVEYIARKTKNEPAIVYDKLGPERLQRVFDLADVYHSDNIDAVSESLIEDAGIERGTFDSAGTARYSIPSHWDIGKVYKRLAINIMEAEHVGAIEAMGRAHHSPIAKLINDYSGSFYYESPQAIYAVCATGEIE